MDGGREGKISSVLAFARASGDRGLTPAPRLPFPAPQERAEERERAKAKEEELDPGQRDEILQGNPLLHIHGDPADGDFSTRRRWDEDVVFRNQTRNQPKKQKRFINDTIRSDFHRRFLDKYMK